jgi:hypothetical protein
VKSGRNAKFFAFRSRRGAANSPGNSGALVIHMSTPTSFTERLANSNTSQAGISRRTELAVGEGVGAKGCLAVLGGSMLTLDACRSSMPKSF